MYLCNINKLIMKKITLGLTLVSTILFVACNKEEEATDNNNFKGIYKITAISSSVAVDINNDGLTSNNFLEEISTPYINDDGTESAHLYDSNDRTNYADVKPLYCGCKNRTFINLRFPIQEIDSTLVSNNTYTYKTVEYKRMNTDIKYAIAGDQVTIDQASLGDWMGTYAFSNFAFNCVNRNVFEVSFDYKVLDYAQNQWVQTNLKTTYQRVE